MSEEFSVEILTPEKEFANYSAVMVVLPAVDGQIGIMQNHIPIIASLGPGMVSIYSNNNKLFKEFFVCGGFVEFKENTLTLMVDVIKDPQELDAKFAKKQLDELTADLNLSSDINLNQRIMKEIKVNEKIIEFAR